MYSVDRQASGCDLVGDPAFQSRVADLVVRKLSECSPLVASCFQTTAIVPDSSGAPTHSVLLAYGIAGDLSRNLASSGAMRGEDVIYVDDIKQSGVYLVLWAYSARTRLYAICKFDDGSLHECIVQPGGRVWFHPAFFPDGNSGELWKIGEIQDCL